MAAAAAAAVSRPAAQPLPPLFLSGRRPLCHRAPRRGLERREEAPPGGAAVAFTGGRGLTGADPPAAKPRARGNQEVAASSVRQNILFSFTRWRLKGRALSICK